MLTVITGNGKGKTTSGLGMIARAYGHNMKCAVIQFIKTDSCRSGEHTTFEKLGIKWENFGEGFTWEQKDLEKTSVDCRKGFESFMAKASSGEYSMILLDEFTYALSLKLIDEDFVINFLRGVKDKLNIVITGRDASDKLVELSDTVSYVREVKHHFNTSAKAVEGYEY